MLPYSQTSPAFRMSALPKSSEINKAFNVATAQWESVIVQLPTALAVTVYPLLAVLGHLKKSLDALLFITSAADRYIHHVLYQGTQQQQSSPKFSYHTHVTDISIGRTHSINLDKGSIRRLLNCRVNLVQAPLARLFCCLLLPSPCSTRHQLRQKHLR